MGLCQKRTTPKARLEALMRPFDWISCPDPRLAEAIQYLSQHPGKQLRSRLTQACAELVAGEPVAAAAMAGEAIELLHTYSLVHDDLPAMDDDDLRRGQPTLHCAFDEATAILAGDGLQAAAFQRITEIEALSAEQRLEILKVVSIAVGFQGMVGGQALDLAAEHQAISDTALRGIHDLKTGALEVHDHKVADVILIFNDKNRYRRFSAVIHSGFLRGGNAMHDKRTSVPKPGIEYPQSPCTRTSQ